MLVLICPMRCLTSPRTVQYPQHKFFDEVADAAIHAAKASALKRAVSSAG